VRVGLGQAAIVGLGAGLLGGLFGVGGGFIIVPGLMWFVGMDRRLAHGTALAATLPIALASLCTYVAHDNVDWVVALVLAIGSIVGAVVGTHLLRVIPKRALIIVFVITVSATAARLLVSSEADGRAALTVGTVVLLLALGLLAGTLAGLLGIGGGVVLVPAMVVFLGMAPVIAKGTSSAVIVPTSIVGTLRNRRHANADIRTAITVGLFGALSAVVGGTIAEHLSDSVSNVMFAALLVFVAITQLLSLRGERPADGVDDDDVVEPRPVEY
jgi:uncharacterized membrane protein YfcA